jgi:hypothetical protein
MRDTLLPGRFSDGPGVIPGEKVPISYDNPFGSRLPFEPFDFA